ncbi:hypothetical protein B0W81_00940 [Prochlorococcus sp. HOT_208_60]|nr:hypothetical protein B0W81_00940 [Prochlorococcus sp. HOT_208_60]
MVPYSHLFFDCDGVVLNSNYIKTRTFYDVAFKYGEEKAQELVKYHITNGGVSRYKKFEFFLKEILKNFEEEEYINLLNEYGNLLKEKLINAEVADGIYNIKNLFPNALNAIISGSDENELKLIFDKKKISHIFNYGIFGSPKNKFEIFDKIYTSFKGNEKVIFFGDSKYDYLVSKNYNMDFIFIYEWTELKEWKDFTRDNNIQSYKNVSNFFDSHI